MLLSSAGWCPGYGLLLVRPTPGLALAFEAVAVGDGTEGGAGVELAGMTWVDAVATGRPNGGESVD